MEYVGQVEVWADDFESFGDEEHHLWDASVSHPKLELGSVYALIDFEPEGTSRMDMDLYQFTGDKESIWYALLPRSATQIAAQVK